MILRMMLPFTLLVTEGQMDRWIDKIVKQKERLIERVDRQMKEQVLSRKPRKLSQMDGQIERQTNCIDRLYRLDGCIDAWINGQIDGWMDLLMDGWMDLETAKLDGWMDGWSDREMYRLDGGMMDR